MTEKYKYLAIDYDGRTKECETKPFNNGCGRWFTNEILGKDNMRVIEYPVFSDYEEIFDARIKKEKGLFDAD